jgi:uncharacterized membrane protein
MSKRRREIKKRKQQQDMIQQAEEQQASKQIMEEAAVEQEIEEPSPDVVPIVGSAVEAEVDFRDEPGVDDSEIIAHSPPPAPKTTRQKSRKDRQKEPAPAKAAEDTSWLGKNKENLLLGMLVLYVFLLGLGTMGELFEIEWILNLPLFR